MLFSVSNLTKRYGALEALSGLSVEVDEGSVGLLGPNGAGKTTLVKILLGLIPHTSGEVELLGRAIPQNRREVVRRIGYMPETDCYLPYSNAVEFVTLSGRLAGMPKSEAFRRAHQVLQYLGLEEARYRELEGFSAGMKQRVKLAQGLVHGPDLIFLDEPTSGLDPTGRDEMLEIIEDVKSRDIDIVMSSHVLHEVEEVCESVLMLNEGQLVHYGPVEALTEGGERSVELRTRNQNEQLAGLLRDRGLTVEREGSKLHVRLPPDRTPRELLAFAVEADIQIRHFAPSEMTLETAFLELLDRDEQRRTSTSSQR